MWDIFMHDWWIGTILWIGFILLVAHFLAKRLGNYWYLLAALLLYWWYDGKTHPHDAYLFDLHWPFLVVVGALWLSRRWNGAVRGKGSQIWKYKAKDATSSLLVSSLLTWFVLYTALYLHMNFFHRYVTAEWFDHLVTWLLPWFFWVGFIVATIGVILARLFDGGIGRVGARIARGGAKVVRVVVIFAMLATVLANIPGDYERARSGIEGWWDRMDHPNKAVQSELDVLGQKPSATATGSPTTTASPTTESRGGMVDNSLDQGAIDAITVVSGAESSPCDWTGVDTKTVAKPEGATNNDTDVDQVLVVYKPGFAVAVGANGRRYSDSIQLPLRGSELLDQSKDLKKAICEDPLQGAVVANMFAGLKIGDQQRPLTEFNPWLQPFAVDVQKVNGLAASYMPFYGQASLTSDQAKAVMDKNVEYQVLANRLGTLLDRIGVVGVQSRTSNQTWNLTGAGVSVGGVPEVGLDPLKDTKPALVYQLTQKNTCAVLLSVGFNIADKRPEVFSVPSCADQAKPKPATTATATATKSATSTQKSATTKKNQSASTSSKAPKPPNANECKLNWREGCPPNAGDQDLQSNDTDTGATDQDGTPDPTSGSIVIPSS